MSSSELVKIVKLSDIDSALQSPDMYFGDIKVSNSTGYIYDETKNIISKNKALISQVLLKMVDELLMNTTDNYIRSMNTKTKMTYIKVNITNDIITVENNGLSIPIKKYEDTDLYVPQIVFSSLFTSSNFNDKRTGAGKNGVGASITNIMSSQFIIDINCDGMNYKQVIENNSKIINEPIIKAVKGEDNYVRITFKPDMKRIINMGLDDETKKDKNIIKTVYNNTIPFIKFRVVDVAASMNYYKSVKVYLNNVELKDMTLLEYSKKITGHDDFINCKKSNVFDMYISTTFNKNNKLIITFVNNIKVSKGIHIDKIIDQISDYVSKQLKIKGDKIKDCKKIISGSICLIMSCNTINPMFEGQGKNKLQKCDNINNIKLSTRDLETLYESVDFDTLINGKATDDINKKLKIKKGRKLIIDKLNDAELAGSKQSKNCTLFLCEGDSAAKLAKDGIAQLGHDKFGVYPLGGKPLNVRGETITKINNNKTVMNLAKILGLSIRTEKQIKDGHEIDLNNLRYGRIVMLKDADTDGAHIMGLVINLLEQLYPELLNIKGFFNEFITPMIKLVIPINIYNKLNIKTPTTNAGTIIKTTKNIIYPFYNVDDYNNFINTYEECRKYMPMYIKGLGGHNDSDTREYFKNYINNVVCMTMDDEATKFLNIAFNKKLSDKRKQLLETRTGEHSLPRFINKPINCSDFINNDWIDYSYDACIRAIPSIIDGLKPSQRKVLYVMLNNYKPGKSNTEEGLSNFKKVFQICGEVAQKGYYHHGDQSLNATIIGMAQDFSGSNNLPLLAYSGSFGSRDMNGEDASAPRYIAATIHEVARYIFPKEDDKLLTPNIEDNVKVEPKYYIPIIPMVLVNGAIGIGTGYSTMIPQHNPIDIINNVIKYMSLRKKSETKFPRFKVRYNYYKGKITYDEHYNKCVVNGVYSIKGNRVSVSEVPFQISKQKFKQILQKLYTDNIISDFSENKTKTLNDFSFEIIFNDQPENITSDYVEHKLSLIQFISMNNMNGFNSECKLTEYNNEYEIFKEWFNIREKTYIERKKITEESYEQRIKLISEKARFIQYIIEEKLIINKRSKDDIINQLTKYNFMLIDDSYNYLLNLPVITLTKEQYEKLCKERDNLIKEFNDYKALSVEDIWKQELNNLKEYIINNYNVSEW